MTDYRDNIADDSNDEPSVFIQSALGFVCVLAVIAFIFSPLIIENLS